MTAFLDRLLARLQRLAALAVLGGGLLMLAAALLVAVDVTLRKLFAMTVGGADELSGYAFAIGAAWSFAFVLLARGNVRIDALYLHLPPRLAALLDLVALIATAIVVTVITRWGFEVVSSSWSLSARSNSALQVPLWIPQSLWWAGWLLFIITVFTLALRTALALAQGDLVRVRALAGARSVKEDAADEAAYARSRESA